MSSSFGTKLVFIAAWKALFSVAAMKSSSENDNSNGLGSILKNDRFGVSADGCDHLLAAECDRSSTVNSSKLLQQRLPRLNLLL